MLAAAVVAVAIGVGGWAIGRAGSHNVQAGRSGVVTAAFVTDGKPVGQLIESRSTAPWVYMAVETDLGSKTVICELTESNGRSVWLGQFKLEAGYGEWGAAVPLTAKHVTGARLVDGHGVTLATAKFA
jgi:hypothetical protein